MEWDLYLLAGDVRHRNQTRYGRNQGWSCRGENHCERRTYISRRRTGIISSYFHDALPHSPISQLRIVRSSDVDLQGKWRLRSPASKVEYCTAKMGERTVTLLQSRKINETAPFPVKSTGSSTDDLADHLSILKGLWQVQIQASASMPLMLLQAPKCSAIGGIFQCRPFGSTVSRYQRRWTAHLSNHIFIVSDLHAGLVDATIYLDTVPDAHYRPQRLRIVSRIFIISCSIHFDLVSWMSITYDDHHRRYLREPNFFLGNQYISMASQFDFWCNLHLFARRPFNLNHLLN